MVLYYDFHYLSVSAEKKIRRELSFQFLNLIVLNFITTNRSRF